MGKVYRWQVLDFQMLWQYYFCGFVGQPNKVLKKSQKSPSQPGTAIVILAVLLPSPMVYKSDVVTKHFVDCDDVHFSRLGDSVTRAHDCRKCIFLLPATRFALPGVGPPSCPSTPPFLLGPTILLEFICLLYFKYEIPIFWLSGSI